MQDKSKDKTMGKLVDQWQQSGISRRKFCETHRIKMSTFGYWVKKLRQAKTGDAGFTSLTIGPEPGNETPFPKIEIELSGGLVIRIY